VTIAKGRPWGAPGALPASGVVVHTDAEARHVVEAARRAGSDIPTLGLLGGDLCKTLGGLRDEARLRSDDAMTFPVDIGRLELDGSSCWFVAHAVARGTLWLGRAVAVMNAQWMGEWDLGPKAHPDDALLDITDGALPLGDLLKARKRVRLGTHLPHPALHTSRTAALDLAFDRPRTVWLDGERIGRTRRLQVEVEPDALRVVV
jgi:YegS C-terminal NAD kinase beta sandwich-like domain